MRASMASICARMPPRSPRGAAPARGTAPMRAPDPAAAAARADAAERLRRLLDFPGFPCLLMRPSPVLALEFAHEADQRLDGSHGHGVVEAPAHAAENAVPLEIVEPGGGGLLQERGLERGLREREGDVHPGARVLRDAIAVERRAVDRGVQRLGLGPVALAHG